MAEINKLRTAITNPRFIVNNLKSQFGTGFSAPELPSQRKAPFSTPPPASASSSCKKQRLKSYSRTKTTRKLNVDNLLDDTLLDAELAKVLQDAEGAAATTFATKPQESVLGVTNKRNGTDIKGGGKTSGETAADYAHLTGNGEEKDMFNKPSDGGASA